MRSCWGSEISGAGSSRSWTTPPYASMPAPLTCSTSCPGSASRHRASASLLPHSIPANSSGGSSPPFTSRPVNNPGLAGFWSAEDLVGGVDLAHAPLGHRHEFRRHARDSIRVVLPSHPSVRRPDLIGRGARRYVQHGAGGGVVRGGGRAR